MQFPKVMQHNGSLETHICTRITNLGNFPLQWNLRLPGRIPNELMLWPYLSFHVHL